MVDINDIAAHHANRREAIYKGFSNSDDIIQKGEGDKGGHIIGHTKSGKPIYGDSKSKHKGWNARDHKDAAEEHGKLSSKHDDEADQADVKAYHAKDPAEKKKAESERDAAAAKRDHHSAQREHHMTHGEKLQREENMFGSQNKKSKK